MRRSVSRSAPILALIIAFGPVVRAPARETTESGIPLTAPWQQKVYEFAQANLKYVGWGWAHSERDYNMALQLASAEKLAVDTDVLFAAAFLHDVGAFDPYSQEDVEHALRSTQVSEELLRDAGFPMEKFPAVKEAMLGHMYSATPGKGAETIVLHDADTLEFLGAIGVARQLAMTGTETDFRGPLTNIEKSAEKMSSKLVTQAARAVAAERVEEMNAFLKTLDAETSGKKLL